MRDIRDAWRPAAVLVQVQVLFALAVSARITVTIRSGGGSEPGSDAATAPAALEIPAIPTIPAAQPQPKTQPKKRGPNPGAVPRRTVMVKALTVYSEEAKQIEEALKARSAVG